MYTAVDIIHILVILWNIIKRPFYIYYKVLCNIITFIWNKAYSYGHFDVSYISVGQNTQPEFAPQESSYDTWRYGCIFNGMIGAETLEGDTEHPVCTTKTVYK